MPAKSKSAAKKSAAKAPVKAVKSKAHAKPAAASGSASKPKKGAVNSKSLIGGKAKGKAPVQPAKPAAKSPVKKVSSVKKNPVKPVNSKKPATKPAPAKPAAKKEAVKKEKAAPKAALKTPAPAVAKKKDVTNDPAPLRGPATGKTAGKARAGATVQPSPQLIPTPRRLSVADEGITLDVPKKPVLPLAFLKKQRQRLIELRDAYMNSAEGVANDTLRAGSEGGESAFGMHQADAGSDAYDRDFALSLLAKEQDAIYEINEALKRIDLNTYGLCEMSGNLIPEERLEALPFTRFTVSCQERIEREQMGGRWNRPVRSLFGLDESAEDAEDDKDEEETSSNSNESLDFSKE